jgi:hypothetical protein
MPTVLLDPIAFFHLSPWSEKRGPLHFEILFGWPVLRARLQIFNQGLNFPDSKFIFFQFDRQPDVQPA